MKSLFFVISILSCTVLIAQKDVSWIGGTPGQETNWNEARNWSTNHVPDEFSNVIIKWANSGHHAQPVIDGEVEVLSITVQGNATLAINEQGRLIIDGEHAYTEGIQLYGGRLINDGQIELYHIDHQTAEAVREQVEGTGLVIVNTWDNNNQVAHN